LVLDMLYDGLVRWDSSVHAVVPAIAKSWTMSSDGLTWTFELDPAATFSNGRAITSADVKFSLERIAARGAAVLSGAQLVAVKGYGDFVAKRTTNIAGLVATDPARFVVTVGTPLSSLPELLASPVFGVVAREAFDSSGALTGDPIASGPFAVMSSTADKVVLARAARSHALLDGVNVTLSKDAEATYQLFAKGSAQLASISAERASDAAAASVRSDSGVSYFYGMNVSSPVLANAALRAAIIKAIDRDAIRAKYFAQSGELSNGLIPSGVGGRDNACAAACVFDAAAAKQMVTAALAGKPAPTVHVDYFVDADGHEAEIAKTIADSLVAVGLPAEPRSHTFEQYNAFVSSGAAELFRFGWVGTYLSPDAYLAPLFGSVGSDNVFGLKDADADKLINSARTATEPNDRMSKYVAAEDRILSLAPIVPIVRFRSAYAVAGALRGVTPDAESLIDIERVWLAH
jgi:ABC-type oligopeptide transport system substrate-binding subunit